MLMLNINLFFIICVVYAKTHAHHFQRRISFETKRSEKNASDLSTKNVSECETPTNQKGTCVNVWKCSSQLRILFSENHSQLLSFYMLSSVCDYKDSVYVCCPESGMSQETKLPKPPHCGIDKMGVFGSRIVGGRVAKSGEYPWQVILRKKNAITPFPKGYCGGSLITDKHILTAAHCIYNKKDIVVILGVQSLYNDKNEPIAVEIENSLIHENYDHIKNKNDIALLTLKHSVHNDRIYPICLPLDLPVRTENFTGKNAVVSGFGKLNYYGKGATEMHSVVVPIVSNEECKERNGEFEGMNIDENVLCAGYAEGKMDSCSGDSGGPLVVRRSTTASRMEYTFQIGVVSVGYKCAEPGYPGVYTRVTKFLDWIQDHLD